MTTNDKTIAHPTSTTSPALKAAWDTYQASLKAVDSANAELQAAISGLSESCGSKTFIIEAVAAEMDMPVLVLKNIRSQWYGQTDVLFERLRRGQYREDESRDAEYFHTSLDLLEAAGTTPRARQPVL